MKNILLIKYIKIAITQLMITDTHHSTKMLQTIVQSQACMHELCLLCFVITSHIIKLISHRLFHGHNKKFW